MPTKQQESKSPLERELISIRDVVTAMRRLDDDDQRLRVLSHAFAHLKGERGAMVLIQIETGRGITWKQS